MQRYNDGNSKNFIERLGCFLRKGSSKPNGSILFENSFAIMGDIEAHEIIGNYDLYVLGNIKADILTVKKNLYVFGKFEVNEVNVHGDLFCNGDIISDNISTKGNTHAKNMNIINGTIGNDLLIDNTLFVDGMITVSNNIICMEGITGSGTCSANTILVNDYIDVVIQTGSRVKYISSEQLVNDAPEELLMSKELFINDKELDEFSEKNLNSINKTLEVFEDFVGEIEKNYEFDEISVIFDKVQKKIPFFSEYLENYKQILRLADLSSINNIDDFIILLNLKQTTPKFLYKISIVEDVLEGFYINQKSKLFDLKTKIVNRKDIIQNLYFLELNKHLLTKREYLYIFDELCLNLK